MSDVASFRPSRAAIGVQASMTLFFVWLFLSWTGMSILGDYPFGFAFLLASLQGWSSLDAWDAKGVSLDAEGITDNATGHTFEWADIHEIRVSVDVEDDARPLRFVELVSGSDKLAFGSLLIADEVGVHDLAASPTILAVAAARTQAEELYPAAWRTDGVSPAPPPPPKARSSGSGAGLLALAIKLLPKLGSIALKLVKTIKPAAAVATVGIYAALFSWEFAFAFILLIGVHEAGHIYAMFRSGVEVKGLYFLPFFGGAAVGKGVAKTRAASAWIAINGPLWGTILALLCLAGWAVTGITQLAALAGWGALLNLFNLLPVFPLDGGRLFSSFAYTNQGRLGRGLVLASLLGGGLLGYLGGLELLTLMAILGLMEWSGHVESAPYTTALRLLDGRPYGPEQREHFDRMVRRPLVGIGLEDAVRDRAEHFERIRGTAVMEPMSTRQAMTVLGGWAGLIVVLLAVLFATTNIEGVGDPLSLLQ